MIEVELHRVPEGERDYRAVAWPRVNDDNTHELKDPEGYFPLDMHVLVARCPR